MTAQGVSRRQLALGGVSALLAGAAAPEAPRRVISLFPCVDAILLRLADPGQIAGLSRLAHEPDVSVVAGEAAPYPSTADNAESLLALRPDLVVVSGYTARPTLDALRRAGVRMLEVTPQLSVEDSLQQVRAVATAIGHRERGEALVARIREALERAAAPAGEQRQPRALVFQNAGFVAGTGTLIDDMLRRTGFRNMAGAYGLRGFGDLSLERIVSDPPDVLLAAAPRPGAPAWGERVLRHPALLALKGRMRIEAFPNGLLLCGGPVLLQTAPRLAAIRRRLGEGRA
jgi:iron complex transport system substrate-binding protein